MGRLQIRESTYPSSLLIGYLIPSCVLSMQAAAAGLVDAVAAVAKESIAARGAFTLALPGGSAVKALAGLAKKVGGKL